MQLSGAQIVGCLFPWFVPPAQPEAVQHLSKNAKLQSPEGTKSDSPGRTAKRRPGYGFITPQVACKADIHNQIVLGKSYIRKPSSEETS